jgi:hypothetical protein
MLLFSVTILYCIEGDTKLSAMRHFLCPNFIFLDLMEEMLGSLFYYLSFLLLPPDFNC